LPRGSAKTNLLIQRIHAETTQREREREKEKERETERERERERKTW
jgi:hypothetical protein